MQLSNRYFGCGGHSDLDITEETTQKSYIFFDADMVGTKGALLEGDRFPGTAGTSFGVYGFRESGAPIFDKYLTSAQGQLKSPYDYVAKIYRPDDSTNDNPLPLTYHSLALWHAGDHSFYAYYPYETSEAIIDIGKDDNGHYLSYTQPASLDAMVDVMTASAAAKSSEGEVELAFVHRLFALDVVVANDQSISQYDLEVNSANIEFYNVSRGATLYFDDMSPVNTSSYISIKHSYDVSQAAAIANGSFINLNAGNSFLLLPCSSLKTKLILSVENAWGEVVEFIIDLSSTDNALAPVGGFQAGKKYELKVTKGDKGFDFSYNLKPWSPKEVQMEFN